jgi:hypothetical protein
MASEDDTQGGAVESPVLADSSRNLGSQNIESTLETRDSNASIETGIVTGDAPVDYPHSPGDVPVERRSLDSRLIDDNNAVRNQDKHD